MVFSSIVFVFCFLPVFLLCYQAVRGVRAKNAVLLMFSVIFYAWGAPRFVLAMLAAQTANFYLVRQMDRSTDALRRRWCTVSVVLELGLLAYCKYANFFIDNLNQSLAAMGFTPVPWAEVVLPIGISFFTFQAISYTVDVYRRHHAPLARLADYLMYMVMFPQLIAGPIVRYGTVAADIAQRTSSPERWLMGLHRFAMGLAKKVLLANVLGEYVDATFASEVDAVPASGLWLAVLAYTFQIYFDFSGYSDMAIGLGHMVGFRLPENFDMPYLSQSVSEFWRRWHITLGAWMRDYLYIPLGGSRYGAGRTYANLWAVFLLSGLWHGASWTFVLWGAWHGLFISLDRLFLGRLLAHVGRIPRIAFTFVVVALGWLLFRAPSVDMATSYLQRMFALDGGLPVLDLRLLCTLAAAVLLAFGGMSRPGQHLQRWLYAEERSIWGHIVMIALTGLGLLLCSGYITASGFNPFIYFRF